MILCESSTVKPVYQPYHKPV